MFELLIISAIIVFAQIYAVSICIETKIDLKSVRNVIIYFMSCLIIALLYKLTDNFLRVIIMVIILSFFNYKIFNKNFIGTVVSTFLVNILYALNEIIYVLVVMLFNDYTIEIIKNNYFGDLFSNIIISVMVIFTLKIPIIKKLIKKLININFEKSKIIFIIVSILGVIISSTCIYSTYYKLSSVELLGMIIIIICIYSFILYKFFFEKNEKEIAQNRNNILIENIHEYEKVIELQKIEAHENKNQLYIIKEMLTNEENDELEKYISALIKEHKEKDKKLLNKVHDIPGGGIRAIIYSKLVGLENTYDINLIVSKKINSQLLNQISADLNVAICKILGVFLDNAIEAAAPTESKIISVELQYQNNKLKITISNSYEILPDLHKFHLPKYSSKGENRGYGLTLVNNIIKENKTLKNEHKVNSGIFSQILYINLGKTKKRF